MCPPSAADQGHLLREATVTQKDPTGGRKGPDVSAGSFPPTLPQNSSAERRPPNSANHMPAWSSSRGQVGGARRTPRTVILWVRRDTGQPATSPGSCVTGGHREAWSHGRAGSTSAAGFGRGHGADRREPGTATTCPGPGGVGATSMRAQPRVGPPCEQARRPTDRRLPAQRAARLPGRGPTTSHPGAVGSKASSSTRTSAITRAVIVDCGGRRRVASAARWPRRRWRTA
jgi:hypothetical protein